jgi:UDP-hydrolysing UDP-N-acetyl-D-glucosamine 2-epimerase
MRTIGVVTFSRADFSNCVPLLRAIQADPELKLHLMVSGTHLSPEFGSTEKEIEADGFKVDERIEMLLSSDTSEGMVKSVGLAMIGFADSFSHFRPDILLLVGDRFELLAAAGAALPFRIPVAHLSGGDVTEGAFDNLVRNAVSMVSALHFVAMQAHADRLVEMGEEPSRVFVTGDPALDVIREMSFLTRTELEEHLTLRLIPPVLVVTFHPTTLGLADAAQEIEALLQALDQVEGTVIFTSPNADPEGRDILERIRKFIAGHSHSALFLNLGPLAYYSLLNASDLMVGNSSSGICEAPSFGLPAVNIGDRQRGRLRVGNVIDVECASEAILSGIRKGLTKEFRRSLSGLVSPYGDGMAAPRIVSVLKSIDLGPHLLRKKDSPQSSPSTQRG